MARLPMVGPKTAALRRWLLAAIGPIVLSIAPCEPAPAAGTGAADPFDGYVARGYREIATFAATKVDSPTVAAHFSQRAAQAAAGDAVEPETLDEARLDAPTMAEAQQARQQLVARLDQGARLHQPLLAAIAQVNFDCWVVPLPHRAGEPDNSACRRKFYVALSQLRPQPAPVAVATAAPVRPLPPPLLRPAAGQLASAASDPPPMPEGSPVASAEAFIGEPPDEATEGCDGVSAGTCPTTPVNARAPLSGLGDPGHDVGSTADGGRSGTKSAPAGNGAGSTAGGGTPGNQAGGGASGSNGSGAGSNTGSAGGGSAAGPGNSGSTVGTGSAGNAAGTGNAGSIAGAGSSRATAGTGSSGSATPGSGSGAAPAGGAGATPGGAGATVGGAGATVGGAGPTPGGAGPTPGGAGATVGGAGPTPGGAGATVGAAGAAVGAALGGAVGAVASAVGGAVGAIGGALGGATGGALGGAGHGSGGHGGSGHH